MNKDRLVKFIFLVFLCISIFGCVTFNIWNPPKVVELDPLEILGKDGEFLRGRLFSSICESNAYGNATTARNTALQNAAKKANELGFKYFTILWDNTDSRNISGTNSYTTTTWASRNVAVVTPHTNSYNYTFITYECIFVPLYDEELEGVENIFSVSRYLN